MVLTTSLLRLPMETPWENFLVGGETGAVVKMVPGVVTDHAGKHCPEFSVGLWAKRSFVTRVPTIGADNTTGTLVASSSKLGCCGSGSDLCRRILSGANGLHGRAEGSQGVRIVEGHA